MTRLAPHDQINGAPSHGKPLTPESNGTPTGAKPDRRSSRRKTSHLKEVPGAKDLRERLRARCQAVAAKLDKSRPLSKDEMEAISRRILEEMGLGEGYVGWMMVILASEFWRDQVAAVPPSRRLFLLPHCLKHAEGCPADYDQFGLDCRKCGACSIADFRSEAEEMGYKVLVAEGSPIVLKIIVSGYVDAIVGVACLNVLEKAIDKILLAGIPCMATPLLSSDCRNTSVDEDWVHEMIRLRQETPDVQTRTYLHLMREADRLFETETLEALAPRLHKAPAPGRDASHSSASHVAGHNGAQSSNGHLLRGLDPVAATETIAYDFLAKGGKHSRPFITLAAYDAVTGGAGALADGPKSIAKFSPAVRRAALSIETFHKASLVHDDIEDDDAFRYGVQTLHRRYGAPTAINVGDYLIGLGYRLVSREAAELGPAVAADILDRLADAHMKLCEGQGAELLWRDAKEKEISPLDALRIYALKTAPAFEAALYTGLRLAGPADEYSQPVRQLAKNLGVAFQILNDLADWDGDDDNKLRAGGDVLGGRPTVLWALALEQLAGDQRRQLLSLVDDSQTNPDALHRVRHLYAAAGVFETAHRLVDKYQQRAEAIADDIAPDELRRLLYYLIDTVLERPTKPAPQLLAPLMPSDLTVPAQS